MRSASVLILALALACGPPGVGSDTSDTDGSTSTETESSTTETGEPTTTVTSEDPTFVPGPDMPISHCDPFVQDCPEGEKCVPYASDGGTFDGNKCVPVLGDQAAGEPCTYSGELESTDNCDAASFCWFVQDIDGEQVGTCTRFCKGTPDTPECPPGSSCPVTGSGSLALCITNCDPVLQDCDEGFACYWGYDGANLFGCLLTTGDIPVGEACGAIDDCAAGLVCLAPEAVPGCERSACCSSFCDLNLGDGSCEALLPGTVCASFFQQGTAPADYEHVGICVLPP